MILMPTSVSACKPPKRLLTPAIFNMTCSLMISSGSHHARRRFGFIDVGVGPVLVLGRGPQAGRTVQHDQHHRQAVQQLTQHFRFDDDVAEQLLLQGLYDVAQHFRQGRQQRPAHDDAGNVAYAASTTIASTAIDSVSENDSGDTKPWNEANMAPATPPNEAPVENASSLTLRVLMPIALAAISSSRIATQARPRRECCKRDVMNTMAMHRIRNRK